MPNASVRGRTRHFWRSAKDRRAARIGPEKTGSWIRNPKNGSGPRFSGRLGNAPLSDVLPAQRSRGAAYAHGRFDLLAVCTPADLLGKARRLARTLLARGEESETRPPVQVFRVARDLGAEVLLRLFFFAQASQQIPPHRAKSDRRRPARLTVEADGAVDLGERARYVAPRQRHEREHEARRPRVDVGSEHGLGLAACGLESPAASAIVRAPRATGAPLLPALADRAVLVESPSSVGPARPSVAGGVPGAGCRALHASRASRCARSRTPGEPSPKSTCRFSREAR